MKVINGDLFEFIENDSVDAIAHVCNCQGVMGSGVAKIVKERYPVAFRAYKQYERDHTLTLGSVSFARHLDKCVFNLHAQDFYGGDKRHLDYEGFYKCLEELKRLSDTLNVKSIAIPYMMGCDRAGGDWNIVCAMIGKVFPESNYDKQILAIRL